MSFYLDTNLVCSLLFDDAHTARAFAWRRNHPEDLGVGDWTATELAALIHRWARTGTISAEAARNGLADFDDFIARRAQLLALTSSAGALAAELARDPLLKLSAADALHLASAADGGHILVTFDVRLADAARKCAYACETP